MNILLCSHPGCMSNATISCLKDPFGKANEYVSYCPVHAPGLLRGTQSVGPQLGGKCTLCGETWGACNNYPGEMYHLCKVPIPQSSQSDAPSEPPPTEPEFPVRSHEP